jgi:hypothetical protein
MLVGTSTRNTRRSSEAKRMLDWETAADSAAMEMRRLATEACCLERALG